MAAPDPVRRGVGERIQALVTRYRLPDLAVPRLEALLWLLVQDPLAPTSIRDPLRAVDDHLADALVALELEQLRRAWTVVDLGSGAGLPGLALAIALPEASFSLVESAARKCAFLERAAVAAQTSNVEVIHDRAESWRDGAGRFDVALARALAPLDVVAEYAAPLLGPNGTLVVWRGHRDPDEETAAGRAASVLGMSAPETLPVQPYSGARHRHLTLMLKEIETPRGFPRRPGMASKRPLGGPRRRPEAQTRRAQNAQFPQDV